MTPGELGGWRLWLHAPWLLYATVVQSLPQSPSAMDRLSQLRLGQAAEVVDVLGEDALACRLMEMGLTPGVHVRLVGVSPWGDPLEFQIRGYRLSLRRQEAERVCIRATVSAGGS